MTTASIVLRRRPLSDIASSGIVALFAVIAIATSAWHPKPAVAQVAQVAEVAQVEAIPSVGNAQDSGPSDNAGSVPDASTVFAAGGAVTAPEADAPTF